MTDLAGRKPILCLDFDGVCHSYTSGWKGADVIPDDPVPGVFEFIKTCDEFFEVMIFSSRSNQAGGVDAMYAWFEKHCPGITGYVDFPLEKPPAFIGIDDRVITFTGIWPTVHALKTFQPWNKLDVSGKPGQDAVTTDAFKQHTQAVATFLNELYAIMIDPCAEGSIAVDEMCKQLLEAARQQRQQQAYDLRG